MKKTILSLAALVLPLVAAQAQTVTKSPNGNLALTFQLAPGGVPTYSLDSASSSHATSMLRVVCAKPISSMASR